MDQRERSLLVPTLVYLGAVVLIGVPTMMVVYWGFGELFEVLNLESAVFESAWSLVLVFVSLLIGLQLAVEAAAVQLGGLDALERGSRRTTLVRYALLTLGVFCVLAGATWIGLSTALAGFGPAAIALGALVGLAGLFVLYRSSSAFVAGYRGDGY